MRKPFKIPDENAPRDELAKWTHDFIENADDATKDKLIRAQIEGDTEFMRSLATLAALGWAGAEFSATVAYTGKKRTFEVTIKEIE